GENQDARVYRADFDVGRKEHYTFQGKGRRGVYLFVIKGKVKVAEDVAATRDGLAVFETDSFTFETLEPSSFLLIDVPLEGHIR
ncbi:pirin family protein, partial [Candidatus Parcubacteria bacterium]|nr:pirin family protein [Candidatus Parcubacteria bacterium]